MAVIREFNFVREDCLDEKLLVFDEHHSVTAFPKSMQTIEELMVLGGAFHSLTQSRKNGFSGPIPIGWSEKPKGSIRYFIWNPSHTKEEWKEYEGSLDITD